MPAGLAVVLVRPRFPENVGMAARAMANMGVSELILVDPERPVLEKGAPLATPQGLPILEVAPVFSTLAEALAPFTLAFGATARTGGRRGSPLEPEKAAREARACVRSGGRAALVFGPEDRGLANEEVDLCPRLVTIPTPAEHSSLNLAQAVLLLLYECAKADRELPFSPSGRRDWTGRTRGADSRKVSLAEEELALRTLKEALTGLGSIPADNPAVFMQPMRRFLRRNSLRRHEFDMLMGICRDIHGSLARGKNQA